MTAWDFLNSSAISGIFDSIHRQAEEIQKRVEFLEKKLHTNDEVAELMAGAHCANRKSQGILTGNSVPHDVRDQAVDFSALGNLTQSMLLGRVG